jgi:hypothetical protein
MADSAMGPTPLAAATLWSQGFRAWAGYLRGPGAFHVWTDAEWQSVASYARWGGVFPGADAGSTASEVRRLGLRGAFVDLEGQFTSNAGIVAQAQGLCKELGALGVRIVGYSNDHGADQLAPYCDGTWRDRNYAGAPAVPADPNSHTAYQNNSVVVGQTSVDTSVTGDWYVSDGGTPPVATISDAISLCATPHADGYYVVESNGGLWPFGVAPTFPPRGQTTGPHNMVGRMGAGRRIVGFQLHHDTAGTVDGYWFCQDDGGIFPFGAAPGYGAVPG